MNERRQTDALRRRRTHASFFSGVGGVDIGLERAGFKTVSFSEIEPYACSILAERWPGVPNLGNIVALRDRELARDRLVSESVRELPDRLWHADDREADRTSGDDWRSADLWSGGFPCQDLSVGGRRRGLAGSRSGLAFAFLDLVRVHRPRVFLLENVEGLLSSHAGSDLGTLLGLVGEIGYGWAFRLLDSSFFGVPQRRRRVYVLAIDLERHPDERCAGEVLSVATRCTRDHREERRAWKELTARTRRSAARAVTPWADQDTVGAIITRLDSVGQSRDDFIVAEAREKADADRVRVADGVAAGVDDQRKLEEEEQVGVFVKSKRAQTSHDFETWIAGEVNPTLNNFDTGDKRTTTLVTDHRRLDQLDADELNPAGIDGHRYRCTGNGVVSPVAQWIGTRIMEFLDEHDQR
jgi:DNA-cytosine methyltransferase